MRHAFALAGLLCALAASASAQPCTGNLQATAAATDCARHRAALADEELNRLWGVLKPAADRAGWGDRLLREQRAWLARRDARCDPELQNAGSGRYMFYYGCIEEETLARNGEFRRMMP